MARYKPVDRNLRLLPVVLSEQIQSGTFEFALDHLVDHELDLSALDARFRNDETGASAYDPRVMLKIVLLAYSRGLISSRRIEAACLHNVQFIALSGDSQPSYTYIATFVRELGDDIEKQRIDSPEGRQRYSQRIGTVEPVFGNLRHNKRLNRFTVRGSKKVGAQWRLYCLVHNIEKLAGCGLRK